MLGEGSFGRVYKCTEKATGKPKVVKVQSKVDEYGQNMTNDIVDEILLMWFHDHPSTCSSENAYDFGEHMWMILEPMTTGLGATCY